MSTIAEKQKPYDLSSINGVFLPYIFYGMSLVILSIAAVYVSSGSEAYLLKNEYTTSEKPWLLYTGYGLLSLSGLFGALLLKHALFCVYLIFHAEKNARKLPQKIIEKGEKWTSIHLYCGIFSFGLGIGAACFYILANWR